MTIALVTGANRGIGLEVVRQLAQKEVTVILTARSQEKAQAAVDQLAEDGLTVVPMTVDVADDNSVKALAAQVETEYGHLDILINNAAAYVDWSETASTADLDNVRDLMGTNLFGAWRMIQAFLPLIRKSEHPRIVNVASAAGTHGDPYFGLTSNNGATASYGISKAALIALTVKFAAELADTPILVNAAGPGLTATAPGMEAMGARPVAEGAASIVWAAMIPDDGPRGGFFRDGEQLPW
jgi:NAD(P)-dependent dehydrogenase (short-subunit alcohol dehydrogenase family)